MAPGGAADRAGLIPFARDRLGRLVQGDVIVAVNGEAVATLDDMLTLLERRQIGEKVSLSVWRAGRTRVATAVLGSSTD